jgi:DNA-binding IclR family transcriptional regulator
MSQTAARALEMLEIVIRSEQPVGLVDIAATAKLDKSTASRLLSFLEQTGFVRRDSVTRKYEPGHHFLSLAAMAARRSDLRRLADPELSALSLASGETAQLHLRVGAERVCVGGVESLHEVRRVLPLGEPVALYLGPSAKAILAFVPEQEQREILAEVPASKVSELQPQLAEIRKKGYITTVNDRTVGVAAISAPIFGESGVVGSITISGPSERWTPERMEERAPTLLSAVRRISSALGMPDAENFPTTASDMSLVSSNPLPKEA